MQVEEPPSELCQEKMKEKLAELEESVAKAGEATADQGEEDAGGRDVEIEGGAEEEDEQPGVGRDSLYADRPPRTAGHEVPPDLRAAGGDHVGGAGQGEVWVPVGQDDLHEHS